MKRIISLLMIIGIMAGCGSSLSQEQAIQSFTTSVPHQWHTVIFYQKDPPRIEIGTKLEALQLLLKQKGITMKITYQPLTEENNYSELLQVNNGDIIVFDHKGIRFKSSQIDVLEGEILQQL